MPHRGFKIENSEKTMDEIKRIKQAYAKRDNLKYRDIYSYYNTSALFIYQEREKAILKALSQNGFQNLSQKRVLDIGCGYGGMLREFIKYGAVPENCCGIDILPERIEQASRLSLGMELRCENAANISYDNDSFDIVLCFTVFSSIIDQEMKQSIAKEIVRVQSPKGLVLWYDYHMNNPKNPDVKGVTKKEIHELFPDCEIKLKRIIPAPPLLRLIAPYSLILCYLLQKIIILNTHYLGTIRKMK